MKRLLRSISVASALALLPHGAPAGAPEPGSPTALPPLLYWAWERSEDLRGLDPHAAGVAYLAATYQLLADTVNTAPRLQPLRVDPSTPLVAVVRIETDRRRRPTFDPALTQWLAEQIAALRLRHEVRAVQIDFDALESERPFYRDLIHRTRVALGATPLSITALASWCDSDPWIDTLPAGDIDEAVPMLFRMGPANAPLLDAGASGRLRARACQRAVGVSMDEPTPQLAPGRRTYVFSPRAWTPDSAQRAAREIRSWQ